MNSPAVSKVGQLQTRPWRSAALVELRRHRPAWGGKKLLAVVGRRRPRSYPARLPALESPAHWEVRRVSRDGGIRWHDQWVNVSHVFAEEYVAFEAVADGAWQVYLGPLQLGRFDERLLRIAGQHAGTTSRNPRGVLPMSVD